MQSPSVPFQHCYSITDYIPCVVLFISIHLCDLLYNWKWVLPNLLYLFLPSPHPPPLWQLPVCSLYLTVRFVLTCLLVQIPLISKITWYLSFSFWLISLSIIPSKWSMLLQMASSHFLWLSNPLCVCIYTHVYLYINTSSSVSIHLSMHTCIASISWP